MTDRRSFPNLTAQNHQITSPTTVNYNCVAWAAGDTQHWWEPGVHWPIKADWNDYGIGVLERAFRSLGFEDCCDSALEAGFEKIALYGNVLFYSHAARQLPNGKWTSKLGKLEDIEHDSPNDVAGGVYGELMELMKRPINAEPMFPSSVKATKKKVDHRRGRK